MSGSRWWVWSSLVVVVLVSLVDAVDVFEYYARSVPGAPWATHPAWLKVGVHAASIGYLVYILVRRQPSPDDGRWTAFMVGIVLVANVCATTRRVVEYTPGRIEVRVVGLPIQTVYVSESYDALGLCFRSLNVGHWYMVINGELMLVPQLLAPMEDYGFDDAVNERYLCSKIFGDEPPFGPPVPGEPWLRQVVGP